METNQRCKINFYKIYFQIYFYQKWSIIWKILFYILDILSNVIYIPVDYFKYTCQIFEDDYLENDASDEKMLYQIVFLFFYLKSLSARLHYH